MTEAEQFEFKFRLGILYTIAVGALVCAIAQSSGAAGLLGFIALVCAFEVRAERNVALKNAKLQTSKAVVSRAQTMVDILGDVQAGRITKEEGAERIQQLNK